MQLTRRLITVRAGAEPPAQCHVRPAQMYTVVHNLYLFLMNRARQFSETLWPIVSRFESNVRTQGTGKHAHTRCCCFGLTTRVLVAEQRKSSSLPTRSRARRSFACPTTSYPTASARRVSSSRRAALLCALFD
jgi:hypothetical protein